jgi:twinkle protein
MAVTQKDNTWIGDSWDELGFDLKGRDHAATDIKVKCPQCSETRKDKRDPCVSIRPADGVANCKNCGAVFLIRKEQRVQVRTKQEARPMKPKNITDLTDAGLEYCRNRRITQEALNAHKVRERNGMIAFPFFYNGDVVNVKYRGIEGKTFSQEVGGYHILYNYDNAKEAVAKHKKLVITEGEFDALAFEVAGVPYVGSLDSGAPNEKDRSIEGKFECITNSWDIIEQAEVVYIATDNDTNGKIAAKELTRRIGAEKVKLVDFGKYKDANETLLYEGWEHLRGLLDTAQDPKIDGVFRAGEFRHEVFSLYTNGLTKGSTTYMLSIDEAWKWRLGEINLWTGYNNEGKSKLLRYLEMLKAKYDGWKSALFIPEDMPIEEWVEDMIHMYTGKTLDVDAPDHVRATPEEVEDALAFVHEYFHIIYPEDAFTLELLFEKFLYLVRRHGVRIIDIDPYNTVEHFYGRNQTTDLYISDFMGKCKRFAVKNKVAFNIVAHQTTPDQKTADGNWPKPNKYRIKGGGTFSDKADNVLSIWRPRRATDFKDPAVIFTSEKIKKQKYVGTADLQVEIEYDFRSNRYLDLKLNRKSPLEIPLNFL